MWFKSTGAKIYSQGITANLAFLPRRSRSESQTDLIFLGNPSRIVLGAVLGTVLSTVLGTVFIPHNALNPCTKRAHSCERTNSGAYFSIQPVSYHVDKTGHSNDTAFAILLMVNRT